jgi:hypothetical protein
MTKPDKRGATSIASKDGSVPGGVGSEPRMLPKMSNIKRHMNKTSTEQFAKQAQRWQNYPRIIVNNADRPIRVLLLDEKVLSKDNEMLQEILKTSMRCEGRSIQPIIDKKTVAPAPSNNMSKARQQHIEQLLLDTSFPFHVVNQTEGGGSTEDLVVLSNNS